MLSTQRGFTLIELLVVIAIIGVLSSVVLASLNSARQASRDAARIESLSQVKTALELYYDDNKVYPGSSGNAGWYDMNCDGVLTPDDGSLYTDFSTLLPAQYIAKTPTPVGGVCLWYQYRNSGTGYRLMFIPEQPSKVLPKDQDCYNPAAWYCTGVNW